jgi:hypothetical protein
MEAYGKALFAEDPQKDWLTREYLWEATMFGLTQKLI